VIVTSAPGAGARFSVLFPPAAIEHAYPDAPSPRRAPTSGRIVLVDDEVSVANFMSEALRDAGYETVVFNESLSALRYLEQHHAHVAALLTDHQMPVMTGVTLAERARAIRADLPIALVSAHLNSPDIAQGPFDLRLAKPFRMDELAALLAKLVPEAPSAAEPDQSR
jgi:CheY-like chemotaxis protein